MRAAWYDRTGAAREVLQVGELPTPEPGPGEVRVRLQVSGANPSDTKRRSAWSGPMAFPRIIPHSDGAGVIDAVGEGVPAARIGERVWTWNAQFGRPFGTAAEYIALPSAQAVRLPDAVDLAVGACLGIPALTAHRLVFADGPVIEQVVLVNGGAGAVGQYAIGLAKWGGAHVIATVSSPAKGAIAQAAGADEVIDYRTEDVAARVNAITHGARVDRIVEVAFGRNLALDLAALKRQNGIIAAYGSDEVPEPQLPFYQLLQRDILVRFVLVYIIPDAARVQGIADITACLETGMLRHPIGMRVPLDEIVAAHEAVEQGAITGKVLLDI